MEKILNPGIGKGKSMQKDFVCFSHLRWDFVYQRPQHLMSRFAKTYRLFFVEEPKHSSEPDHLNVQLTKENVWVVTPMLQEGTHEASVVTRQRRLVDRLIADKNITEYVAWYYTPMALKFTNHLKPATIVHDCMDELSAFKFAPAELKLLEAELLKKADVVFTGGHSLYQAKKNSHHNIYPFPSSIDKDHFQQGRRQLKQPADQESIQAKRLGFYGVIDERFDIKLIAEVAKQRPEWQIVLVGPVVKIDEADLPRLDNIHYLGGKNYNELPVYLSGWDIALIPFEKNESTKFISPTKTPEYLAAGKPVISSSINDVVHPYFDEQLVHIADTPEDFIRAAEAIFSETEENKKVWLEKTDAFLADLSWDNTCAQMLECINNCVNASDSIEVSRKSLKSVA